MADTVSPAPGRTTPDLVTEAYATGGLPPALALLLPILIALCGLAAVVLAPKDTGSASVPPIDPTITGSIAAAPLFEGRGDAGR